MGLSEGYPGQSKAAKCLTAQSRLSRLVSIPDDKTIVLGAPDVVKAPHPVTDAEFMRAAREMAKLPDDVGVIALRGLVASLEARRARTSDAERKRRSRAVMSHVSADSPDSPDIRDIRGHTGQTTMRAGQVAEPPLELAIATPLPLLGKGVGDSLSSGSDSESVRSGSESIPSGTLSASGSGARVCVERSTRDADFARFWKAYPKKVGKIDARAAWNKRIPPIEAVLAALEWQRRTPQWLEQGGQFIVHPSVWLNRGSWDDEPVEGPRLSAPAARMVSDALKSRAAPVVVVQTPEEKRQYQLEAVRWAQANGGLDDE